LSKQTQKVDTLINCRSRPTT